MTQSDDDPESDGRRRWHLAGVVVILVLLGVFMLRSLVDRSWNAHRNEFSGEVGVALPVAHGAVGQPPEDRVEATEAHPEDVPE